MGFGKHAFRERLLQLADEYDELLERCNALNAESEELHSKLKSAPDESLAEENRELKGKVASLEKLEDENRQLRKDIKKLEDEDADHVKDVDGENRELKKKLEREVERSDRLEKDNSELAAEMDSLKSGKGAVLAVRENPIAPLPDCSSLVLPESLTALQDPVDSILSSDKQLTSSTLGKAQDAAPPALRDGASPSRAAPNSDGNKAGGAPRKDVEPSRDKPQRGRSETSRRCDGNDAGSAYSGSYSYSRDRGSREGSREKRSASRRRRTSRREDRGKDRDRGRRGGRRRRRGGGGGGRRGRRRRRRGGSASGSEGRGRSDSRSRSRSGPPRRGGGGGGGKGKGNYGSGDHRTDLEGFISKNQLEARVAHALRSMNESDQKKVMGTDGGENSYMLLDRVKSPNGVVMSRIRKIESAGR